MTGRMLGSGGAPIGGARVELEPIGRERSPAPNPVEARTAADGTFRVQAPAVGLWRLAVAAAGLAGRELPIVPLLEDTELAPIELVAGLERGGPALALPAATAPVDRAPRPGVPRRGLAGRVLDRDTGTPLAGALVWLQHDPGGWVLTDAEGAFRLPAAAPSPTLALAIAALGHESGLFPLNGRPPSRPVVLALPATAVLAGVVVEEHGGFPLADAAIEAWRVDGTGEPEIRRARSTAAGAFGITGLRSGASYVVRAALAGRSSATIAVSVPRPAVSLPPIRLALGPGRIASGLVVDEAGRPIAGARVELVPEDSGRVTAAGKQGPPIRFEGKSDGEGAFVLRDLPGGELRLRIEAEGFLPLERPALRIVSRARPAELGRFVLSPGTTLRGRVDDTDGRPLSRAEVWILPPAPRDWAELYARGPAAVTGPDGSFTVGGLPRAGRLGLDVCHPGHQPWSTTVREIPDEPLVVALEPAATIAGEVTSPEGDPLSGARVESWLTGEAPARAESLRPCRRGTGTATTDAAGGFRLTGLAGGWWEVKVRAEGYLAATREKLHVREGESLEGVRVALGRGALVAGRVSTADGTPAAGARLSALSEVGAVDAVAGGDGEYWLAGVEPGEQVIEAVLDDGSWASRSLTVLDGHNRLDLTVEGEARRRPVRGRVVGPDGAAVAGATVLAGTSGRTFSAASGAFGLELEDGHVYELWAEKGGFAPARSSPVAVDGAAVDGVVLRLQRGVALTGRLLGLDDEELAQASVEVEVHPQLVATAAVDPRGGYRIEGLPPGGRAVTARANERVVRVETVLPPGQAETILDIPFEPSYEVSGWVLGPGDEAVGDAYVRFLAPGGLSRSTYSRSDGSFRLRLEAAVYRAVGRGAGYAWSLQPEPVAVEGPLAGVELRLRQAAVIRGSLVGLEPGERAEVWAAGPDGGRREGQLDQEGGFVIRDVPPGEWTIKAACRGGEWSSELRLESGDREAWVSLDLSGT